MGTKLIAVAKIDPYPLEQKYSGAVCKETADLTGKARKSLGTCDFVYKRGLNIKTVLVAEI